jgi:hypothetical protein
MHRIVPFVLGFIFALQVILAGADSGMVSENICVLNQPFKVVLQVNRVSAFVMPGPIQSTRLPTAYIKDFNVEADTGTNILYISPKKEAKVPCTLFIVVEGVPYEFSLTATITGDYQHQIIIGESPVEVAKRKEVETMVRKFEAERGEREKALESFISTIRQEKKIKRDWQTLLTQGPLVLRLCARIGDYYLLQTNIPEEGFTNEPGATWLFIDAGDHKYVLTTAKKFRALDKEIKL